MFRCLLIVAILVSGVVLSTPWKTGVRDCGDMEEFDENFLCHMDQMGDRLRKLNRDLDNWADKREKGFEKIIRSMDRNLNKIQNRGPVAALLGDLIRMVGVVAGMPFVVANVIFRDILGLNKFWSYFLTFF